MSSAKVKNRYKAVRGCCSRKCAGTIGIGLQCIVMRVAYYYVCRAGYQRYEPSIPSADYASTSKYFVFREDLCPNYAVSHNFPPNAARDHSLMVRIPNTPISVDEWTAAPGIRLFFLTHAHAGLAVFHSSSYENVTATDHTEGLSSTWALGPIYCTAVTRDLVIAKFNMPHRIFV
jgi:hypothetical protein